MFVSTNVFAPAAAPKFDTLGHIKQMIAVRKQRRDLAQMDPTRLQDLGLTPEMVAAEAARPFWDI